jgi:hypothetical protein
LLKKKPDRAQPQVVVKLSRLNYRLRQKRMQCAKGSGSDGNTFNGACVLHE